MRYLRIPLLGLLLPLLAGCERTELEGREEPIPGPGRPAAYISVSLSTGGKGFGTKASGNPTGGEEGDGREPGKENENRVNDLTLFLYKSGLTPTENDKNGINVAKDDTPIEAVLYFDTDEVTMDSDDQGAYTAAKRVEGLPFGTYDLLVVINTGDRWTGLRDAVSGRYDLTVGRLRQLVSEEPAPELPTGKGETAAWDYEWTENADGLPIKRYTRFRMASVGRSGTRDYIEIGAENSDPDHPAVTNPICVERLAARVEVQHKKEGYDTTDKKGHAAIAGVALVNRLTRGCYFFKRVTDQLDATTPPTLTYLGKETETNWVQDLYPTPEKQEAYYYPDTYFKHLTETNDFERYIKHCESNDHASQTWHLAGYALENVNEIREDADLQKYATGVVFKALYTPIPSELAPVEEGEDPTFFKYSGYLFRTLSEAMTKVHNKKADERTWQNDPSITTDKLSVSAWKNYLARLQPNGPTGYREFLEDQLRGRAPEESLSDEEAEALRWTAFMESAYGYKETTVGDQVRVDIEALANATMKQRMRLAEKGFTRTFLHGFCYYTYWIKHNNDGDDKVFGPMEYAIVRNNIYQLTIRTIAGLGSDIPGTESLDVQVAVQDWGHYEDDPITLHPEQTRPGGDS